eukprot:Nitzschia sp. Nitz4//scaffold34_size148208//66137//67796//NITZ4_002979-RA/size148208-exonerate_est2genome-gene-0.85-mRNA-1//1//CDS//3329548792//5961//frame0
MMGRFNTRWNLLVFVWLVWNVATTPFSVTWAFVVSVPIRTLRLPVGPIPLVFQPHPVVVRRCHDPAIIQHQSEVSTCAQVPHSSSSPNHPNSKRSLFFVAPPSWQAILPWISQPNLQRPENIPAFIPTWIFTLRHWSQLLLVLVFYGFHTVVLSQQAISFPFQLLPNERGHFQSIGMDTLVGFLVLMGYGRYRRTSPTTTQPASLPWNQLYTQTAHDLDTVKKSSRTTCMLLLMGFISTSFLHPLLLGSVLSLIGKTRFFPWRRFSQPMRDSISILFGHLVWVAVGTILLRRGPRPQPLHGLWYVNLCPLHHQHDARNGSRSSAATRCRMSPKHGGMDVFGKSRNLSLSNRTSASPLSSPVLTGSSNGETSSCQWAWWVIGGYYISAALFNVADLVNLWFLPTSQFLLRASQELDGPLPGMAATVLGSIAPCITAPWWEEVLYRGFLLPTLSLFFPLRWAVLWTSTAFSLNHISLTSFIPLVALGWTWSYLYIDSGNLWAATMVHALWNTRVVLGAWLGL